MEGLYVPTSWHDNSDLLVAIHGCRQNREIFSQGTRFNEWAEKKGVLIYYPQQKPGRNIYDCWNWFEPDNQTPDRGEPLEMKQQIDEIKLKYKVKRVFVTGISSGGAMATIMISCFPDLFDGAAIHSGMPYGIVSNAEQAVLAMIKGPDPQIQVNSTCDPSRFKGRVMVIQGKEDHRVEAVNARRIADDYSRYPYETLTAHIPATDSHYAYDREDRIQDHKLKVRYIAIEQLGHAWSGGNAQIPYNDAKGPDVRELMWDFFNQSELP